MKRFWFKQIILLIFCFLIGGSLGWCLKAGPILTTPYLLEQVRSDSSEFRFINPLLFVKTSKDQSPEFESLRQQLAKFINTAVADSQIDSAVVYFRDLRTGNWTGVNEDDKFTPASLLKVAVAMSILKKSEDQPSLLDQQLYYDVSQDVPQHYSPPTKHESGYYSIRDLIRFAMIDSDNVASATLMDHYNKQFNDLYATFRLPELPADYQNFMSPRVYSTLFRSLYNGTYLSDQNSEQLLNWLTESTFKRGLAAGLPVEIKVAHKFGENSAVDSNNKLVYHQLHDCGIIYYPTRPYFLCVMSQGKDFASLEEAIKTIAQIVFQQVSSGPKL